MKMLKLIVTNIKEWWEKYLDFLYELPDGMGLPLLLVSIIIPVIIFCLILTEIADVSRRSKCLDSSLARRYNNWICEEYHDNEWIEIDLSENIYYYNESASRELNK
jgi:hypothetical protein